MEEKHDEGTSGDLLSVC